MTAAFDPDEALEAMTAFLTTGVRTVQGYGAFAYTVRDLSNHLSQGGRLPVRWQWAAAPPMPADPDELRARVKALDALCRDILAAYLRGNVDGYLTDADQARIARWQAALDGGSE